MKRILDPNSELNYQNDKMKDSIIIRETKNSFICEICQKSVDHSMHFIFHRKRHLDQYPIHCCICLKFFFCQKEKIVHEKQCNELRYDCYACGMILCSLASLKYHFQVHSGIGSIECGNSSKGFKRSYKTRKKKVF